MSIVTGLKESWREVTTAIGTLAIVAIGTVDSLWLFLESTAGTWIAGLVMASRVAPSTDLLPTGLVQEALVVGGFAYLAIIAYKLYGQAKEKL